MANKNIDDYLTEGMYGKRQTKPEERKRFLGTLQERIVLALTKGQVISDKGLKHLEEAIRIHPEARLILNGKLAHRFLKAEKSLARQYDIPYTEITNEDAETDIGAVLTYDYAIEQTSIFVPDDTVEENEDNDSLFDKIKQWFS